VKANKKNSKPVEAPAKWEVLVNDDKGVHSPTSYGEDLAGARAFAGIRSFFRRDACMLVRRVGCKAWFEAYRYGELDESNEGLAEYPAAKYPAADASQE
jgi:hypothetical protein